VEEQAKRVRSKMQLYESLAKYPVCVMADPSLVSYDDLPRLDIIDMDLRAR